MNNFSLSNATLADLAKTAAAPKTLSDLKPRESGVKRMDPVSARALECLAHAIEYLEDTTPFYGATTTETESIDEAIRLLKSHNREIFAALPVAPPRRTLLRAIAAGWDRSRVEGRHAAGLYR